MAVRLGEKGVKLRMPRILLLSDDALVAQEFQKIFERLWEEGKPLKD